MRLAVVALNAVTILITRNKFMESAVQSYDDLKMAYMDDEELEAYYCANPHLRPAPKAPIDPKESAHIEASIKMLNEFMDRAIHGKRK